jgi:general secretion pathway protein B
MSYILDALKKSEQERGHGNIPDVQTVHSSSLNYQQQKKSNWPYFLITAVLLNLIAITYFIVDKDNTPATEIVVDSVVTESAVTNNADTNIITTKSIAPAIKQQTNSTPATTILADTSNDVKMENKAVAPAIKSSHNILKQPVSSKTIAEATTYEDNISENNDYQVNEPATTYSGDNIIDFNELPEATRLQLPAIIISSHVYSSNPLLRSIVINNNFMEEGEYLIDGLVLYEITPDGAIFNYQGSLFNYGVVSGWQ